MNNHAQLMMDKLQEDAISGKVFVLMKVMLPALFFGLGASNLAGLSVAVIAAQAPKAVKITALSWVMQENSLLAILFCIDLPFPQS